METRNSKTEMPLSEVKDEKFIFAVQMKLQGKCRVVGENRMEKIKLTDICNPKQWKTIPTSELLEDGYPVYGANGIIGYYSEFNHKNPVITVTCRGATCGTINITVPKSYVTGNAMCLDDVRSDIYMEYLYYCLKHYNFNNVISGSAQPQITRQGMEKIYVTIGSHNEQMDIVDKLKKVENVIGLKKQELKQLDTFVKSRFIELFGDISDDEKKTMADICTIITDGTHQPPKFVSEGIPFLFVSNIVINEISYDTQKFISEETYAKLIKRTPIEIGDILLSTVGSYGHPAVVKKEKPFCFQRHIAYLKPNADMVDSEYLRVAILSADVQRQIDEGVKGIAQKTLNLSEIRKIKLPLPPIDRQKQFAAFVAQTDKSKSKIQKSLEETQLLFDSLMQKYFG